jgi:hypothetical protein
MDGFARILDVLGSHNPYDDGDCGDVVTLPAMALAKQRLYYR